MKNRSIFTATITAVFGLCQFGDAPAHAPIGITSTCPIAYFFGFALRPAHLSDLRTALRC